MNNSQLYGKEGEDIAYKHLKKHGYKILKRNFKCPIGELDLIAMEDGELVFVEVKSRNSNLFGRPCEAVDYAKQRKLQQLAFYYINLTNNHNINARFDVVEVCGKDVNVIKNAWEL